VIDPPGRASRPSPLRVTARCGSCRLPLQRLTASSRWASTVTRARSGSRGVGVPFRGLPCRPGSALLASSAPPSPFETASGSSLSDLTPRTKVLEVPLLEFASPSEPNHVSAARASVSRSLLAQPPRAVRARESPLLEFSLPWAHDAGCPVPPTTGRKAGAGRVRVANPPPEPSSGFLPLSTVLAALAARTNPLRSPSFAVAPRRFAALFHAARALGVALQSFPFSRSRTRSRGPPASLRVRVRPPNGAARSEGFAAPFPDRADLSPRLARRLVGLEGRDDGSLESLGAARHALPRSSTTSRLWSAGLAGLGGRHARFEALLPSRVRSRDDLFPGQGTVVRSVLSWASSVPRVRLAARAEFSPL